MQDIGTKVNGVSTLSDSEFNQIALELETAITASGQALSGGSTNQIARSLAIHLAYGDFYTDGGSANNYVLSPTGAFLTPSSYTSGMRIRFKPANSNSGASTINVNSLGSKSIKQADGSTALTSGQLPAGIDVTLVYDGTNFRLIQVASSDTPSGSVTLSPINVCEGRLTLTSGTPVTTLDVSAAGTVYYTPYVGNRIALYDGSAWSILSFTQLSFSVPASATTVYDVFAYNNTGSVALETLAWASDTARATALVYQDGVLVKSGNTTRRYIGSFRTVASAQTEDSAARRLVFNYYNRVLRPLYGSISTATWTYTSMTVRAQNTNTTDGQGRVAFLVGVPEDGVSISSQSSSSNPYPANAAQWAGYALDSTSVLLHQGTYQGNYSGGVGNMIASGFDIPSVGYHYAQLLESSQALGTTTWYGTSTYSSIKGTIRA